MGRLGAAPKGKGGGKGGILKTAGKIAGGAIEAISMPQQALFRTMTAAGALTQGNVGGALSEVGKGLVDVATLGQARGNIDFAQAVTPYADRQAGQTTKLPTGLNTLGTVVADPLNFLTGGTTMAARQGAGRIAKHLGGIDPRLVKESARLVGGKAVVDNIGRDALRTAIADDVLSNSSKVSKMLSSDPKGAQTALAYANKQADDLINAFEKRGGGGLGFHVPGTDIQNTLISGKSIDAAKSAVKGTAAAQAVAGSKAGRLAGKVAQGAGKALIPGKKMARQVGEVLSTDVRRLGSARVAKQEATIDNLMAELDNSVKASQAAKGVDKLDESDDRLLSLALEATPEHRAAILSQNPHLEPLAGALDRVRKFFTEEQIDAKLLARASIHDTETYLRRNMTPEMLDILDANPNLINEVAGRIGGSTKSALTQKSTKARKWAPDMPVVKFNELVERAQGGEDVRALLDLPEFDQYIGVGQKAHAQELLTKQLEHLKSKPLTDVTPEQLIQEAKDLDSQLSKAIDDAIEAEEEEFTFMSNVYKTPQTPEQHAALKNYLGTLTMAQKVDVNSSNWSNGVAQAISDTANLLPGDIAQSRIIFLGNSSPENRLPHFNKFTDWLDGGSQEAAEYTKALQDRLKALGYPEEMYVFRGYHSGNSSAEFANVSTTYHVAQNFSSADSIPRIYKVKLADVLGAAHEGEGELIIKATRLEQIHADDLKALRLPKKENLTFKSGSLDELQDGDKFRYNNQSQVLVYRGTAGPGFINVEYSGVNNPVVKKVPSKPGQAIEIVSGIKDAKTALAKAESAVKSAADEASDEIVKQLAAGKRVLAEQLIAQGAITRDQLAKQMAAAFKLAEVNSDVKPLKDLVAKQAQMIATKLPPGAKVYQESALASVMVRAQEASRALQAANYIKEMRGLKFQGLNLVLSDDDLKAAKTAVPHGYSSFDLPLGPKGTKVTFHAPESVAEEVQKVVGFWMQDDSVKAFDKFQKSWMQFWKTHATTGLIGALPFGTRNFRSNLYLMAAGGMSPQDLVRYQGQALDFQRRVHKIIKTKDVAVQNEIAAKGLEPVLKRLLEPEDFKMFREAQDRGILTQGFFDFDFEQDVMESVKKLGMGVPEKKGKVAKAVTDVVSHKGAVAQKGRQFNSAIEHNARLAAFMHQMDRTGDWQAAADHVKAVLFDYSDLTALEQKRLKAIIPFYTFMRKNIPLQFRTLIENPTRVTAPEKLSAATSEGLDKDAPDYQKDAGSRKSKLPFIGGAITTPDRPLYAAAEVFSPLVKAGRGEGKAAARDLANVVGGPQVGLGKALAEIGTGKDQFTGGNVRPGAASAAQRLGTAILPSLGRLPRAGLLGTQAPAAKLSGKTEKSVLEDLARILAGQQIQRPKS